MTPRGSLRQARAKPRGAQRSSRGALVLRRLRYGETSLVADVLTAEHGRVSILARGAYRPTSRFYCVLDWFHRLELTWRERLGEALALLEAGDVERSRRAIPRDLARYRHAHAALELAERATRPGFPSPDLFQRTEALLEGLESGDGRPPDLLARFDLTLLAELGLAPALESCARCGRRAPEPGRGPERSDFSAEAGGRLCPECARGARGEGLRVGRLPAAVLERAGALGRGQAVPEDPPASVALGRFLERFLVHHLESDLVSRGSGLASAAAADDSGRP